MGLEQKFWYVVINVNWEFYLYDFVMNVYIYFKLVCYGDIDVYVFDLFYIYFICDNFFYIKDFVLKIIDLFFYWKFVIKWKYNIDFSIENLVNLFKVKDYFVVMYYVVDEIDEYWNMKYLFYYFNCNIVFFVDKMCSEFDILFQYFCYLVVVVGDGFIYYFLRVMNCVLKFDEI